MLVSVCVCLVAIYAALRPPPPVEPPSDSRWIKVARDGVPVDNWSGPWQCVFDQQTGLLWEVKTDNEGIHDGYWSYSWFDGTTGIANMGDCYFEEDRCDTLDLIKRVTVEKACGASEWRLPEGNELLSLVQRNVKPGDPAIAKDFFPFTKRGDYWTGQSRQPLTGVYRHLGEGALAVNFVAGSVVTLPYRNAAFVRLVATDYRLPAGSDGK